MSEEFLVLRQWNQEFYTFAHIIIWGALLYLGSRGWRSGERARLPQMWPGFKSRRRRHMWVELVVGSLLCSERFFSGYFGFPPSSKTSISKFQFDQESGRRRTTLWMCYLQIIIYLLFFFIYYENSFISVNGEEITYINGVLGWL